MYVCMYYGLTFWFLVQDTVKMRLCNVHKTNDPGIYGGLSTWTVMLLRKQELPCTEKRRVQNESNWYLNCHTSSRLTKDPENVLVRQ